MIKKIATIAPGLNPFRVCFLGVSATTVVLGKELGFEGIVRSELTRDGISVNEQGGNGVNPHSPSSSEKLISPNFFNIPSANRPYSLGGAGRVGKELQEGLEDWWDWKRWGGGKEKEQSEGKRKKKRKRKKYMANFVISLSKKRLRVPRCDLSQTRGPITECFRATSATVLKQAKNTMGDQNGET